MPWEPRSVVVRVVVAEIVQQQEWIEILGFAKTEGALQFDAGALDGRFGVNDLLYWAQ
jgi:hypothetical protein